MTLLPKSTRQFLFVFLNLLKMPFGFLLRAIVLCLQELDVLLGAQRFPLLQPLNAETACLRNGTEITSRFHIGWGTAR